MSGRVYHRNQASIHAQNTAGTHHPVGFQSCEFSGRKTTRLRPTSSTRQCRSPPLERSNANARWLVGSGLRSKLVVTRDLGVSQLEARRKTEVMSRRSSKL